jgi:hypothetical protein
LSLVFNKRLANRWMLRGHVTWQDWEWSTPLPSDPDAQGDPNRLLGEPFEGETFAPQSPTKNGVFINSVWSYDVNGGAGRSGRSGGFERKTRIAPGRRVGAS